MKTNIHFIFGTDEFFVDLKTKKQLKTYQNLPLEVIDGSVMTIADLKRTLKNLTESLQTMDFFSTQKCVWLRSTNFFSHGSPALTEGGQTYVEAWFHTMEKLPDDVHLFISATSVDKRTRLFKNFQGLALCEELEDKNFDSYLQFLIKKLCQEQGVTIQPAAINLLTQKLNYQPRTIANEFEKLACLKNFTGEISLEDVTKHTPTLPNDEFFEPVEAFYIKDETRYIRSLRNHFLINKEMRSVLTMMQNRNRLLIQLSALNLPTISKKTLDEHYCTYENVFGPIQEKNTFCIFSQNPWYLSRLNIPFSLQTLLELQCSFIDIFDKILTYPQKSCAWMESLVRFFK